MALWVYFDASAIVKRYSRESGTEFVNEAFQIIDPARRMCLVLAHLEILSVLVRKRNDGRLDEKLFGKAVVAFLLERDGGFASLPVDPSLIFRSAVLIEQYGLNATDALLLRSVLDTTALLREGSHDLLLIAADKRLNRAAEEEGISVLDPEIAPLERLHQMAGTTLDS